MAASKIIRKLFVAFGVKTSTAGLKSYDKSVQAVVTRLGAATASALAASAAFGYLVNRTATWADQIVQGARRVQQGVKEFQVTLQVARQVRVEQMTLERGFGRMGQSIERAAQGSQRYREALGGAFDEIQRLGTNISSYEAFDLIKREFDQMESGVLKLARARTIFGRGGQVLLPILEKEGLSMANIARQAESLGLIFSDEDLMNAEEFKDLMVVTTDVLRRFGRRVVFGVLPTLNRMLGGLRDWYLIHRQLFDSRMDRYIRVLDRNFRRLETAISFVNRQVEKIGGWERIIRFLGSAMAALMSVGFFKFVMGIVAIVGGAGAGVFVAFGLAILKVVALVGLLAFAFDDLFTFIRGGDSVIGLVYDAFDSLGRMIHDVVWMAIRPFGLAWDFVIAKLNPAFLLLRRMLVLGKALRLTFSYAWDGLAAIGDQVTHAFTTEPVVQRGAGAPYMAPMTRAPAVSMAGGQAPQNNTTLNFHGMRAAEAESAADAIARKSNQAAVAAFKGGDR